MILGSSAQFNDPVTGESDLQVNEFTGGNADLQPEKSDQLSLGIVWQPLRQFSATVDWFRINLEDIIATPATQDVVSGNANGNPAYANAVVRDASGNIETVTSVTVNSGDATVQGFDVALQWKDTFSWGTPSIGLLGTYIQKFDQTTPGGVEQGKVGTIVDVDGNPVLDADTGGVVPRWMHLGYRGFDPEGALIEREATGFHARVVQHECDHLDGILYPMRIRDFTRFGYTEVLFPDADIPED